MRILNVAPALILFCARAPRAVCQTMVDEVEIALSMERPSMDLDMRSRLDPRGKRKGKVVDWKLSETRAW